MNTYEEYAGPRPDSTRHSKEYDAWAIGKTAWEAGYMAGIRDKGKVYNQLAVYHNPSDYPGKWVLREWEVFPNGTCTPAASPLLVTDGFEEIRNFVSDGWVFVARAEGDDPCIYGVFV